MKTNGNPRFVKDKQFRSSGKSTQNKKKKFRVGYNFCTSGFSSLFIMPSNKTIFIIIIIIIAMKSGAPLLGLANVLIGSHFLSKIQQILSAILSFLMEAVNEFTRKGSVA